MYTKVRHLFVNNDLLEAQVPIKLAREVKILGPNKGSDGKWAIAYHSIRYN